MKLKAAEITGPQAATLADLVTPGQLSIIRNLSRNAGVDADRECERFLKCPSDSLSKLAASRFIDHLKSLVREGRRAS